MDNCQVAGKITQKAGENVLLCIAQQDRTLSSSCLAVKFKQELFNTERFTLHPITLSLGRFFLLCGVTFLVERLFFLVERLFNRGMFCDTIKCSAALLPPLQSYEFITNIGSRLQCLAFYQTQKKPA